MMKRQQQTQQHTTNAISQPQRVSNKKLIGYLLLGVVGMFGFGFALVPLYDIMCQQFGINGKTSSVAASTQGIVEDRSRLVRVQFIAQVNDMPWDFKPTVAQMDVYPGQVVKISYFVFNHSMKAMTGQAVPSVAPGQAASHFNKVECFCFHHQPLAAGSKAELPLIFYIDPQLPSSVHTLTLSYTLYDITDVDVKQTTASNRAVSTQLLAWSQHNRWSDKESHYD